MQHLPHLAIHDPNILVFRRSVKTQGGQKDSKEKLPGPDHFDEVDVEGADDDGGPDGGHAQPVVHSRISEIHHQVIVPLQQPHREARLEKSKSINPPDIFDISLAESDLSKF